MEKLQELKQMAIQHYDLIYSKKEISSEEAELLKKELDDLRAELKNCNLIFENLDDAKNIIKNATKDIVKKLIKPWLLFMFLSIFLMSMGLLYLVVFVASAFFGYAFKIINNSLDKFYKPKYDEELLTPINIILDNCERMIARKLVNNNSFEENKKIEESRSQESTLEDYANYVFEHYLETGEILSFLNPEFDTRVKIELSFMLIAKYGITYQMDLPTLLQSDLPTLLCIASKCLENEKGAKLDINLDK